MTHADDQTCAAAVPAAAPVKPRAPRAARALLLGTCGAALLGLTTGPLTSPGLSLAATTATAPVLVEVAPHGAPVVLSAPVRAPRPARATRTRPAPTPVRNTPVKKKPAASTGKKASFTGGWSRPSYASVISNFGPRWGRMHKGIDFGDHTGASIRAVGDGVVVGTGYQGSESGYGNITIIRHASGYYSAYAHQSRMVVHTGERVHAGEVIGYVGSTGHVTGPHLHFEIRTQLHGGQVNPLSFLRKRGVRL